MFSVHTSSIPALFGLVRYPSPKDKDWYDWATLQTILILWSIGMAICAIAGAAVALVVIEAGLGIVFSNSG
jgi:hypothetical protein